MENLSMRAKFGPKIIVILPTAGITGVYFDPSWTSESNTGEFFAFSDTNYEGALITINSSVIGAVQSLGQVDQGSFDFEYLHAVDSSGGVRGSENPFQNTSSSEYILKDSDVNVHLYTANGTRLNEQWSNSVSSYSLTVNEREMAVVSHELEAGGWQPLFLLSESSDGLLRYCIDMKWKYQMDRGSPYSGLILSC